MVPFWALRRTVAVVLLACCSPLLSGGDGKFELSSERQLLEIPYGYRGGASPGFGALSLDGKTVLMIKAGALTTRPLDSAEEKQLLPVGSIAGALGAWACWSANGQSIYYLQAGSPGINDLWRLDVASLKKEVLIKDAGGVSTSKPSPSPDGKSIAFYRGKALMLARADGANPRVLCERCDPSTRDLAWSPDSSQIVFVAGFYAVGETKFSVVKVATGETKSLRPQKGNAVSIAWPSWSDGPFVCMSVVKRSENGAYKLEGIPIFHLALPQEVWIEVTTDHSTYYSRIFGSGAEPCTLIAQRMQPPPGAWDFVLEALEKAGLPVRSEFQPTVILTLRK
jgi:hypothetical protein